MTVPRSWSLVWRLAVPLAAIMLLTACVQALVSYRSLLREADEVFDAQLRQTAEVLAMTTPQRGERLLPDLSARADGLGLVIRERSASGEIHNDTGPGALPAQLSPGFANVSTAAGPLRVYTVSTTGGDISVGQHMAARRELAREIAMASLWPLLLLSLVSLLVLALVLRAALRPIAQLDEDVRRREPHSLTPLRDPGLPRELTPLLHASNGLIERLSTTLAHQKRFLADAAHELRTPMSAIRLQNTLLERADNDSECNEALAMQREGIRRASGLVDQLLRLSRLDSAELPLHPADFDLAASLQSTIALHAANAAARGIRVGFSGQSLILHSDRSLADAVFGNLIGNAIQHCPRGSSVDVVLSRDEAGSRVTVDDNGPGIEDDAIAAMLQPFHRGETAAGGGSGLGLSIANAACERAGWRLALSRSPTGGLRATVHLT